MNRFFASGSLCLSIMISFAFFTSCKKVTSSGGGTNRELSMEVEETYTSSGDTVYNIVFDAAPLVYSDLNGLIEKYNDPKITAAIFIASMNVYAYNRDAGLMAMNQSAHSDITEGSSESYSYLGLSIPPNGIHFIDQAFALYPKLPTVYFEGATKENNYSPNSPLTVQLTTNSTSGNPTTGQVTYFVMSDNIPSPRPITLKTEFQKWKILSYQNLLASYN